MSASIIWLIDFENFKRTETLKRNDFWIIHFRYDECEADQD